MLNSIRWIQWNSLDELHVHILAIIQGRTFQLAIWFLGVDVSCGEQNMWVICVKHIKRWPYNGRDFEKLWAIPRFRNEWEEYFCAPEGVLFVHLFWIGFSHWKHHTNSGSCELVPGIYKVWAFAFDQHPLGATDAIHCSSVVAVCFSTTTLRLLVVLIGHRRLARTKMSVGA